MEHCFAYDGDMLSQYIMTDSRGNVDIRNFHCGKYMINSGVYLDNEEFRCLKRNLEPYWPDFYHRLCGKTTLELETYYVKNYFEIKKIDKVGQISKIRISMDDKQNFLKGITMMSMYSRRL